MIAIPILLFVAFVGAGLAGFLGVTAAYSYYSEGLPDPKALLTALVFDEQTVVTDRTGTVELARLGERKREVVTFSDLPDEVLDATTAIEDKDFWENPGFDLAGFLSATVDTVNGRPRGGSTITQQLVRARLLPPSAFEDSREERKIREIIQSLRLTQEFPGVDGKQQIITAYMNQNFYGNQSYGVKAAADHLLRQEARGPDPGRGGDPRRDPPVAVQLRPRQERRAGLRRGGRGGRRVPEVPACRPGRFGGRDPAKPHPRSDEDREPAQRIAPHGQRVRGGEVGEGRSWPRSSGSNGELPTTSGRCARSLPGSSALRSRSMSARRSTPAATG